jgi:hypothetical protein
MAVYKNIDEFKTAVRSMEFINRGEFLRSVKHATIQDTSPFSNEDHTKALPSHKRLASTPRRRIVIVEKASSYAGMQTSGGGEVLGMAMAVKTAKTQSRQ